MIRRKHESTLRRLLSPTLDATIVASMLSAWIACFALSMEAQTDAGRPVEDALRAKAEEQVQGMPASLREAEKTADREIRASGILERALNVGVPMPSFTLRDAYGAPVESASLLAKGPIVLVF